MVAPLGKHDTRRAHRASVSIPRISTSGPLVRFAILHLAGEAASHRSPLPLTSRDMVDAAVRAVAFSVGADPLHRLNEVVLPVPEVGHDLVLGWRCIRLVRRARGLADRHIELPAIARESERSSLAHGEL